MIAPTHIAFASLSALLFGANPVQASVCAVGSLVPDIDSPNSTIGKVFPFSWWLEARFGHRGFTHSLILWFPLLFVGFLFPVAGWLVFGAITHCLLDCASIAGVRLFYPSHRIAVFGGRNFRIKVGSASEMVLMIVLFLCVYGVVYVQQMGGWRSLLGLKGRKGSKQKGAFGALGWC